MIMIKIIQRKVLIYCGRSGLDVGKIKYQNLCQNIYEKTFRDRGSGFVVIQYGRKANL